VSVTVGVVYSEKQIITCVYIFSTEKKKNINFCKQKHHVFFVAYALITLPNIN